MDVPSIIQIGDCLVSSDILTEYFACDYKVCKGACCVIGDSGAPLDEGEEKSLRDNYGSYSCLMGEKGREIVRTSGFAVTDSDGDLVTPLVPGSEECVYSSFDSDGNCFCTVERCWLAGHGTFRKPVSCWLYPVRVSRLGNGLAALNLHRWEICGCAFRKGRNEKIRVYEFLKEPLVACFGEDFYQELSEVAEAVNRRPGNGK